MPKFTETEKQRIEAKLLEAAKERFITLGLKKTSVEELTRSAGIAQGSFYLFFNSKEELYFEIIQREEAVIRSKLNESFLAAFRAGSAEAMKHFLRESLAVMEENPLIRQMYDEDLLAALFRKLPEEKLAQHFNQDVDFFLPLITEAQQQGWIIESNPATIVSLLRSFVLLALQRKLIGEEQYRETMELLMSMIADGLVRNTQVRMEKGGRLDD
ncbi:TetR/AcrR family transcriptional regulator [Paenibacillus sp. GCM10027626]|uniref:TetR/AcrR family transcriptional regulator n=1 Tax=Paenibacillus sp. GCM10027626 TaxID=3273411 RepID=UPI003629AC89